MSKGLLVVLLAFLMIGFSVSTGMSQNLGFNGIGGRLSYVDVEDVDGGIGFGAHANLGEIIQNLVLYPSFEYFGKTDDSQGIDIDISFISINADARYYIPTQGTIDPFVGGGLAIHFSKADAGAFGDTSETDFGLDLLGGIDVPVSDNLVATAKLKYVISDSKALKITGGITFLLGK
ncbi:MAG TPA: outer membrane beta-barrel protein [bacterium]